MTSSANTVVLVFLEIESDVVTDPVSTFLADKTYHLFEFAMSFSGQMDAVLNIRRIRRQDYTPRFLLLSIDLQFGRKGIEYDQRTFG